MYTDNELKELMKSYLDKLGLTANCFWVDFRGAHAELDKGDDNKPNLSDFSRIRQTNYDADMVMVSRKDFDNNLITKGRFLPN